MTWEPTIRPAGPADLAAIVRLDRDCFGDLAWSAASWADEFDRLTDNRVILVAEARPEPTPSPGTEGADGVPVPLSGTVLRELVGVVVVIVGDVVEVARIGVAPAWRRTGVAGRLLDAALPPARTVFLEVAEGNVSARRFYERHGFREISRRKGYYHGGEDALVFRRIG